MKQTKTKLDEAIHNYVKSVIVLLATVICATVLPLLFYFAPFVFLLLVWLPPCFVVLFLLVRENEKIKSINEWCHWMDMKLNSKEYADALVYLQQRTCVDPSDYYPLDMSYERFLKDHYYFNYSNQN